MVQHELRTGEKLTIRRANVADAQVIIDYINKISQESEMITISPGEFDQSLINEQAHLEKVNQSLNQIFAIALIGNQLVSVADIKASNRKRIKHIGTLGISVTKQFWGKGIGRLMMDFILSWSKTNEVLSKIHLTVRVDNERAVSLYKSLGFGIEGQQKNGLLSDAGMKDVYLMGMVLE